MKEGSRNGASLSKGTPLGGSGGTAPFLGTPKDVLKRYVKRDVKIPCKQVSLHRGPAEEPGGGYFRGPREH